MAGDLDRSFFTTSSVKLMIGRKKVGVGGSAFRHCCPELETALILAILSEKGAEGICECSCVCVGEGTTFAYNVIDGLDYSPAFRDLFWSH